jgi:hypothetical protein
LLISAFSTNQKVSSLVTSEKSGRGDNQRLP